MRPQSLICLLFIFIFSSCEKNKREPIFEDYYIQRDIIFYVKDTNDNNLIQKNNLLYNPDSIKI